MPNTFSLPVTTLWYLSVYLTKYLPLFKFIVRMYICTWVSSWCSTHNCLEKFEEKIKKFWCSFYIKCYDKNVSTIPWKLLPLLPITAYMGDIVAFTVETTKLFLCAVLLGLYWPNPLVLIIRDRVPGPCNKLLCPSNTYNSGIWALIYDICNWVPISRHMATWLSNSWRCHGTSSLRCVAWLGFHANVLLRGTSCKCWPVRLYYPTVDIVLSNSCQKLVVMWWLWAGW